MGDQIKELIKKITLNIPFCFRRRLLDQFSHTYLTYVVTHWIFISVFFKKSHTGYRINSTQGYFYYHSLNPVKTNCPSCLLRHAWYIRIQVHSYVGHLIKKTFLFLQRKFVRLTTETSEVFFLRKKLIITLKTNASFNYIWYPYF